MGFRSVIYISPDFYRLMFKKKKQKNNKIRDIVVNHKRGSIVLFFVLMAYTCMLAK